MDTLRQLAPPDGLKFTPLFSQPLSSNSARITRLEHAVQTLSDDINTMAPTIVRMVAIEGDVKGLVTQLQTLTNQNQQSATSTSSSQQVPPASSGSAGGKQIPERDVAKGTEPAGSKEAGPIASSSLVTPEAASKGELPPAGAASPISKIQSDLNNQQGLDLKGGKKPAAKTPPQNHVVGNVVNMRIGDWPDKTRLVLDVTAKAPAKMHMTNAGKTLVIDLSHYHWKGRDVWKSDRRQLIIGGYVKNNKLYVNLKYASTFKTMALIPPSEEDKNFRLVVDLFSNDIGHVN